ncbi:MAG: hypothetical protein JW735_14635 [Prolixibacteraceae bacterium]|nr:hypothetical protein [Prolixibacteraceae bacterium]
MIKDWYVIIKKQIRLFNLKKDNRPVIFLLCVVVSSILWLVSVLGKSYEVEVGIPIRYTNLPKDKVLVNEPPHKINVMLKSYGFTLLRHKIQLTINPINFNVKQFTLNMMDDVNRNEFSLNLNQYLPQISKQVSSEITLLKISPEIINFKFDQIVSAKKKVKHNFKLEFDTHYFLSDSISFDPDSITVSGPKSIIDSICCVETRQLVFNNINATVNKKNIKLQEIEQVQFDRKKIATNIPVSLYTEYNAEISIEKINVPDSVNMIILPPKVKVKCLVPVEKYANINNTSFIFSVNFEQLNSQNKKYTVNAVRVPQYIKSLNYTPLEVDYLLQKK